MRLKVFLSHVREDADKIDDFQAILEAQGDIKCINYRTDDKSDAPYVLDWITSNIDQADYFLFFWSAHAKAKPGNMDFEFSHAFKRHIDLQNAGRKHHFIRSYKFSRSRFGYQA